MHSEFLNSKLSFINVFRVSEVRLSEMCSLTSDVRSSSSQKPFWLGSKLWFKSQRILSSSTVFGKVLKTWSRSLLCSSFSTEIKLTTYASYLFWIRTSGRPFFLFPLFRAWNRTLWSSSHGKRNLIEAWLSGCDALAAHSAQWRMNRSSLRCWAGGSGLQRWPYARVALREVSRKVAQLGRCRTCRLR